MTRAAELIRCCAELSGLRPKPHNFRRMGGCLINLIRLIPGFIFLFRTFAGSAFYGKKKKKLKRRQWRDRGVLFCGRTAAAARTYVCNVPTDSADDSRTKTTNCRRCSPMPSRRKSANGSPPPSPDNWAPPDGRPTRNRSSGPSRTPSGPGYSSTGSTGGSPLRPWCTSLRRW